MAKHWVYKEILTSKYICNGKAVDFEPLDGNSGVGVFEDGKDDQVLACLRDAAAKQMGGIVFITEQEYTQKKTERPFNPSAERLRQEKLRILPSKPFGPKEPGVVADEVKQAVAEAKSIPATQVAPAPPMPSVGEAQMSVAEAPGFKPATRRMPREKAA